MAAEKPTRPESEEQSIKARKHEIFEEEPKPVASGPKKPAEVYLRDTPALPLSTGVKTALWVIGAIVVLLLIAALLTRGHSRKNRAIQTGGLFPSHAWMVALDDSGHDFLRSIAGA